MKNKKLLIVSCLLFTVFCLLIWWEIYVPKFFSSNQTIIYTAQRGMSDEEIARDLQKQRIIKNSIWFRFYATISRQDFKMQAGTYELSPSMSVAQIVRKFVLGDVIKNKITIIEGWNLKDIAQYLESKNIGSKKDFLNLVNQDFSREYDFLKDKPQNLSLEGYIFPDTYEISIGQKPEGLLKNILDNFNKKMTPELRKEISLQNKSIFQIIIMASILEKEVVSQEDKKIVSGILWKRIENNMGLNVDATINYITGKNDARATINDTKINSPYNTYKYRGLPLGPISNPGMDSILASIYQTRSDYWYYLSADGDGKTIFSKTLEEHNEARAKYLR